MHQSRGVGANEIPRTGSLSRDVSLRLRIQHWMIWKQNPTKYYGPEDQTQTHDCESAGLG